MAARWGVGGGCAEGKEKSRACAARAACSEGLWGALGGFAELLPRAGPVLDVLSATRVVSECFAFGWAAWFVPRCLISNPPAPGAFLGRGCVPLAVEMSLHPGKCPRWCYLSNSRVKANN